MNGIMDRWKALGDKNKVVEFLDVMISGVAQMVINFHPVCGVLLLVAAFVASPVQGISCVWSVLIATVLVYVMGIPMGQAREGLYTLNPALIGMAIPMVTYQLDMGALPQILFFSAIGSALCVLITAAMRRLLSDYQVTPLAAPYSLALALIAGCTYYITKLSPDPMFAPGCVSLLENDGATWSIPQFVEAVLNGIAQMIWLEDVPLAPVAGVIVLIAICCASRIDTLMAIIIGTLATALAVVIGIGQGGIMLGLYGYNAILLSFVIFGRAYKMCARSFIVTVIMALLTVPFTLGLKPLFAVIGAPVAGMTFSIMGIMIMLARPYLSKLVYNEPKNWTVPELTGRMDKKEK